MNTQVFVKIPVGQHEKEAFACGRRSLTAWAEQKRGSERVELSLALVGGGAVSTDSLAPEHARRSSL